MQKKLCNCVVKVFLPDERETRCVDSSDLQSDQTPQSISSQPPCTSKCTCQLCVCSKGRHPESSKDEVERCLSIVLEQQNYLELREKCTAEWQQLSQIFDRFFLVVSVIVNVLVSFFMLVVCPMIRSFDTTLLSTVIQKDLLQLAENNEAARAQTAVAG